jgi:DNA-3-methyladenine glycosylase II
MAARNTAYPLSPLVRARRHLARRDPVLKRVIAAVGPCTLRTVPDGFRILTRAIISQMISTKAALAIAGRVEALMGGAGVTPAALLAAAETDLRGAGLSMAKVRALRDLAERTAGGVLPMGRLDELPDDEVIGHLVAVRGIGRWTAEMFLIFSLGRLDVLPVGDFGLRAGVQEQYRLDALPGAAALRQLAEPWAPYRSIATWYFWRSRGAVPQSE